MPEVLPHIYLFHGEDAEAQRAYLQRWTDRFSATADDLMDKEEFDTDDIGWDQLYNSLNLIPLLSPKRLVIVHGLLSRGSKEIQEKMSGYLSHIHPSVVTVFVEPKTVDAKSALLQSIKQMGKIQFFPKADTVSLRKQAKTHLEHSDLGITEPALVQLLEKVGADSVRLHQELDKLSSFGAGRQITPSDVQDLVSGHVESRIFVLADGIMNGFAESGTLMIKELEYGTPPMQIIGLLISQIRIAMIIKDGLLAHKPYETITRSINAKPYVISKMRTVASKKSAEEIFQLYVKLVIADMAIKQGAEPLQAMLSLTR